MSRANCIKLLSAIIMNAWVVIGWAQSSANFRIIRSSMASTAGVPSSTNFKMKESATGSPANGFSASSSFCLNGEMFITRVDDGNMARDGTPGKFQVMPNFPNPFNLSTNISYILPKSTKVQIVIYNPLGKVVRTYDQGLQEAGTYQVTWNGRDEKGGVVPSGVYYCQVITDEARETRVMTLVK